MNDFVEGKCTLPYIDLYKELNAADRETLVSYHARDIDATQTQWIKDKMSEHKSVEKSFKLAQKLSAEAMNAVKEDEDLVNILKTMIQRSY